ncbi:MAG: ABC transporter permease [Rhodobacteraceae bacterium]|nr:ABC transporter permease [Paracoccaceae bacterium]
MAFPDTAFIGVLHQRLRVIIALVIRETSARFGRSWGGYIWAILEPTGGVALLALVFSYIAHVPPIGSSFMYFYASGFIPFMLYSSISTSTMHAIRANRGLLTYPVVSSLDSILARAILETLTYFIISLLLFPAIALIDRYHPPIIPSELALSLLLAFALGLGIGTLNCVLMGFFPTWQNIWGVLNRPMFIISGVLFHLETLPSQLRNALWLNPVSHVIAAARNGLYGLDHGDFVSVSYVMAISLLCFIVGGFLLRQNESFLLQQ